MGNGVLSVLGEFLVRKVRDESISDWRMILKGTMKGDDAERVRRNLGGLSPEQVSQFESIIPDIVDSVLHNLLWGVEQEDNIHVCVTQLDGSHADLSELSDGLPGELYGQDGWIARFSQEK